jgi:hypothetical protein
MKKQLLTLALGIVVTVALCAEAARVGGTYKIEDLGTLGGGETIAYGINAAGTAAGFSFNAPKCCAQAFAVDIYGARKVLPAITNANSINDSGEVAGSNSGGGGICDTCCGTNTNAVRHIGPLPAISAATD